MPPLQRNHLFKGKHPWYKQSKATKNANFVQCRITLFRLKQSSDEIKEPTADYMSLHKNVHCSSQKKQQGRTRGTHITGQVKTSKMADLLKKNILTLLCMFSTMALLSYPLADGLKSDHLCRQCATVESNECPSSSAFPHMTGFNNSLIAGALQSDLVNADDRGVYSVPNVKGGTSSNHNAYYGWQSTSGSGSGYHSYLTVDRAGKVGLQALKSLKSLEDADWKSINLPMKLNHRGFRFWMSRSTGKCLTVLGVHGEKKPVGVADCKFDGSNNNQFFAFRFHYDKAFCGCGVSNN
ncbi:hypothetical protein LINPERPRIM_LOCUS19432 [Linum perenne]